MNRFLFLFTGLMLSSISIGQVTSTCNVPLILSQNYETDLKQMAIERMHQTAPADLVHVRIPQIHIDEISGRMAAIFNTITSISESDSVFNIYCVHDVNDQHQLTRRVLFEVDTNIAWTKAWRNLNSTTGNAFIDGFMARYDLILDDYFDWSFGHYALLSSDSIWNEYALIDSMILDSGLNSGSVDNLVGGAGQIDFSENSGTWLFDFYFEFNDCFDSCDNYRKWSFQVNPDCSVDYLGFTDWGVFGTSPLPAPVNCNLTSGFPQAPEESELKVYPNPAIDQLTFQWNRVFANFEIEITDIMGHVLIQKTPNASNILTLDISKLSRGVYGYRVISGSQRISGTFIKY
jgi:hypothetical protein